MIDWLKQSKQFPQLYWKPRDTNTCLAATGKGSFAPFYVAPFSSMNAPLWSSFSHQRTFAFEQLRTGKQASCEKRLVTPRIRQINYSPTFEEWNHSILLAKKEIERGSFNKIVLARKVEIVLESPIDPLEILQSNLFATNLYGFYFSPKKGTAFLGASPERLVKQCGDLVQTEALAATRKQGQEQELFQKSKEQREFRCVEVAIEKALLSYVRNLKSSKITLKKSHNLFHLRKKFQGDLITQTSLKSLVNRLHPTPAILGENTPYTWQFLQKHEPFERGLYAGVFGPQEAEKADLCVPIRSCLIEGNSLQLFSGAGIVLESDPLKEWQELDDKLAPYLELLCLSL